MRKSQIGKAFLVLVVSLLLLAGTQSVKGEANVDKSVQESQEVAQVSSTPTPVTIPKSVLIGIQIGQEQQKRLELKVELQEINAKIRSLTKALQEAIVQESEAK